MSTSASEETTQHLRLLRDTLKQPITSSLTLRSLLAQPLNLLALLPSHSSSPLASSSWPGPRGSESRGILLSRFIGSLQTALLEHVVPVWFDGFEDEQEEAEGRALMEAWFVPEEPAQGEKGKTEDARRVAISAYQTLASALVPRAGTGAGGREGGEASSSTSKPPPLAFVLSLLARLSKEYPLSRVYPALFGSSSGQVKAKATVLWESLARTLVSLPGRALNASEGGRLCEVPEELEQGAFFARSTKEMERVVWWGSEKSEDTQSLSTLLQHFVRQGYISSITPPTLPSSFALPKTFFSALLPDLLPNLSSLSSPTSYSKAWLSLFVLLDFSDLARLSESLLRHLLVGLKPGEEERAGAVMELLVGRSEDSLWEKVLLGGESGSVERAKVGVWWVAGKSRDREALERLMQKTLALWSDMQFIKFSLTSKHVYILSLLLLLVQAFPPNSDPLIRVSTSPLFLNALTHYLSHPDRTIRYLGMMGAEMVSARTIIEGVKPLDFGVWQGDKGGKGMVKELRKIGIDWDAPRKEDGDPLLGWGRLREGPSSSPSLVSPSPPTRQQQQPASASSPSSSKPKTKAKAKEKKSTKTLSTAKITILSDSDDSLTGYVSQASSSSSRSDSPSPSDFDEYIEDPTLFAPKKKKVPRPVYLGQLGELFGAKEEPEKLDVALKWGEALIRRKRGFGLELEENTVYITLMVASLNDNFELEDFDNRKQGILNALVACSPEKAAPTLIEQYFYNQYSLQQRSAILTALAMGAREAASLPTITAPSLPSVDWPSKKLPPALHRKFLASTDVTDRRQGRRGQIEQVASQLSSLAIGKGREAAEGKVEEFQREKRLRLTPTTRPATVMAGERGEMGGMRAGEKKTLDGTGARPFKDVAAEFFVLPLLNRFWLHFQDESAKTSRLTKTSSYSSVGTGMILSPLALSKLVATLSVLLHAARHSPLFLAVLAPETLELAVTLGSRPPAEEDEEASVLGACLELALVVLDACWDLDGGRGLMLDKGGLVMGAAEWGEMVFMRTERGERVLGEGGEAEGRVRKASAGLCVLLGEIREKWGRLVEFK